MNPAKAKEHFSAYYEGTLDRGLKQAFETRLREDAQLNAEYLAFENTMQQLDGMRTVDVVVPSDLHERISARVDKHVWEQKREEKPSYLKLLRGLALAGVAGAGFFVAITQFRGNSGVSQSGIISAPGSNPAKLDISSTANGVRLSYKDARDQRVLIKDESGAILQEIQLQANKAIEDKPLTNESADAQLLTVEFEGGNPTLLALPGTVRNTEKTGEGSVADFARALAGKFGQAVVVEAPQTGQKVNWNFDTADPVGEAKEAVSPLTLNVELRQSGIIWIQTH